MKADNILLPFRLEGKGGEPLSEQLVYAVRKAAVSGLLRPGARFPSVRAISQELRIHPNTAHKAIGVLIGEGFLEVHPGIGTVVGHPPSATARDQRGLEDDLERLVVKAKQLRLSLDDLKRSLARQWNGLSPS